MNLNSITEAVRPNPDDLYYYDLNIDGIPDGSLYFYTKFVSGSQAFGRVLNTPINQFSLDAGQ